MARDLPISQWLPIAIILFLACAVINTSGPVLSAGTLRLVCLELGLPEKCDDKIATQTVASWNMTVSLISGCVMFLTVGLWTATTHVIGRPRTIAISLIGIGTLDLMWGMIFRFEALQPHWRYFAGGAIAFNCCTGTMAVILLGVFGAANDITHANKATRGWLFAVLEAIIGTTPIISSRVSSVLVKYDYFYAMFGATSVLWTVALTLLLFYPNTVPEKEQRRSINWNEATILTAITICIPTHSNIVSLLSKKISHECDEDIDDEQIEDKSDGAIAEEENNTQSLLTNSPSQSSPANQSTIEPIESINTPLLPSDDRQSDDIPANQLVLQTDDNQAGAKPLNILTSPYFLPFLAFSFYATMFVLYSRKTILFLYFKAEYKIDNTDYTNIVMIDAIGNAIAVIGFLPLIKRALLRYTTARLGVEISSAFFALFVEGGLYVLLALLPWLIGAGGGEIHNHKIWAAFIVIFFLGLFSSVSPGVLRSAMINSTPKRSQQHRIIACLAAIEGACIISSGLIVNKIYKTFDFVGSSFLFMGGMYLVGGSVLLILFFVWLCVSEKRWNVDMSKIDPIEGESPALISPASAIDKVLPAVDDLKI